ncbi:hypothetical protein OLT26_09245, partial [Campylobacter jejuni]|nr:hypothetical protein [Campylobacter jejuni]
MTIKNALMEAKSSLKGYENEVGIYTLR